MATVQRPEERYVDFDEYIDIQLDKARSGIKWTDILAAAAGVVALVVAYLVLFVIADQWLFAGGIPTGLRRILLGLVGVIAVAWIGWKVVWPYLRRVNDLYAAQMLERAEPSLRGSLFGLVDARRAGRPPVEEVRRALERRAATTLSDVDVDAALDRRLLMRMSYVLLGVVLFACIYAIASPKRVGPSLLRALLPTSNVGVATRTEILDVRPGDATVLAGEQLPVSVMIRGETPEKVMLFYSTADRRFVDEPVELRLVDETAREYQATLIGDAGRGLAQDLSYRIVANDDAAGPFAVSVDQPPAATIKTIALQYPPYTGLQPSERDAPPIEGIDGTNVTLTAVANRPLKAAKLVFADDELFLGHGEEVPLRISDDGLTLTASWKLAIRSDGSSPTFFRIECRDKAGKTNPKPAVYPVKIFADAAPEVTLHDPKSDLERPANAIVPLIVTARDPDFRLRELTLRIEKRGQELPDRTVLWEGSAPEAAVRHDWDLGPLALKPGDIVSFYVQARDNREPEANRRNTPKLNIKITEPVSKEDVQKQLEQEKQRQEQEIAELEQNAAGADAERQPNDEPLETAGNEAEKTQNDQQDQNENSEPSDAQQSQDATQGDEPNTGDQGSTKDSDQRDSTVKNDGSQDDKVLRKLLQRQREQQQRQEQSDDAGQQQDQQPSEQRQSNEADRSQQGEKQSAGPGEQGDSSDGSAKGGAQTQQPEPGDRGEDRNEANGSKGSEKQEQPQNETPSGERSEENNGGDSRPRNAADRTRQPNDDQPNDDQTRNEGSSAGDKGEQNADAKQNQNASASDSNKSGSAGNETTKGAGSPEQNSAANGPPQGKTDKSANSESGSAPTEESDSDRSDTQPQPSQPTDEPAGDADPNPGEGRPDQKSQRPDSGERGTGQPNVDGTPDGQPGPGDAGTKPGSQQETNEATGQQDVKATEKGRPGDGTSEQANDAAPSSKQASEAENAQRSSNKSDSAQQPSEKDPNGEPGESTKQSPASQRESTQQPSPPTQESGEPGTPQTSQQSDDPQADEQQPGKQDSSDAANQPNESESDKSTSNQSDPSQAESKSDDSGTGQSGEAQSGNSESGKSESGKGESGKGESGKGESGKGESGKGESGKGETGKGESGKVESGKCESGKGESEKGESGKGESGKGESGKGESGESGSQSGESGTPGQQGGKTGKPGGKPGAKGGEGGGAAPSNNAEGGATEGDGTTDADSPEPTAEDSNPEYTKQATDLVLKKLEDDLARGDVDPELLKQLGWTEQDMQRFADRLRKNLEAPTGEETAEELAHRKEFEHMLENLTIDSAPQAREGRHDRVRNVEGVGAKRPPIPSAYRAAYEAFTRRVAGRRPANEAPAASPETNKP